MPVTWTIEGESGAGWDATARSPEYYGLSSGSVTRGSIAEDILDLTALLGAWGGGEFALPTRHQRVTLKRDGVVYFRGWAMEPKISAGDAVRPRVQIVVASPAYWLRRQPVRSAVQAPGFIASANRNQIRLASGQTLSQNIATLISAYNDTLGSTDARRIASGSIASTWAMPVLNLSGGDFLSALMELMRNVPDATAYWSYQSGTHQAQLTVTRRATATTRTLVFPGGCASAAFEAAADHEADGGVVIDYAQMVDDQSANTGKPRYLQQASDASFSGAVTATARAQRLTVSGPEIDSFLPDSPVDSSTVTSAVITGTILRTHDAGLAAVTSVTEGLNVTSPTVISEEAGKTATLASHPYYLTAGEAKDWWANLPSNLFFDPIRVTVKATYTLSLYDVVLTQSGTYPWGYYSEPGGINSSGYREFTTRALSRGAWEFCQIATASGMIVDAAPRTDVYQSRNYYTFTYSASASVTAVRLFVASLTVYKRPDFQFYAPPSGLADNLAKAQNFVPWSGAATVRTDTPGSVDFRGCKLDVEGIVTPWETMGAMIRSHRVDLFTGSETISCGPPARISNLNLAYKLRTDPQGNITYL